MLYCCLYCCCFLHCSCSCCSSCRLAFSRRYNHVVLLYLLFCVVVLVLVVAIVVGGVPSMSSFFVVRHSSPSACPVLPFLVLSQCIVVSIVSCCFALFRVVSCCCCPCPCGCCCVRIFFLSGGEIEFGELVW